MVDSEYSPDNYKNKSLKISIGAVIKNLEILKFVSKCIKTKKMCKNAAKKLLFKIRYVPDQYENSEMCDKDFLENAETLKCAPDH